MFCINCGNRIDEGDNFCCFCGFAVEDDVDSKAETQSFKYQESDIANNPSNLAIPTKYANPNAFNESNNPNTSTESNNLNTFNESNNPNTSTEFNTSNKSTSYDNHSNKQNLKNRKSVVIILVSVVLTVVLVLAGSIWYFAKNRTSGTNSSSANSVLIPEAKSGDSADSVAKSLENKGFRTKIIDEFSASKRGNFLRYANVKPGSKVSTRKVVKIIRSKGPGVPARGVVGENLSQASKIVKSMGVPVKLHRVPVTDSAADKIVASSPLPGNAVGKDGVINIAVGEKCDGVPVDLFGLNRDKAKDMLSSKPFSVDLRPKFSSPKYFGKIVGAYPALGTKGNPKAVTLYYGVDASKAKDVVTEPMNLGDETAYLVQRAGSFVGKWCTNSGKCITLVPHRMRNEQFVEERNIRSLIPVDFDGTDGRVSDLDSMGYIDNKSILDLNSGGQDPTDYAVFDKNIKNSSMMRNHLISGDTGAVELYSGGAIVQCGNQDVPIWGSGVTCLNGKYTEAPTDSYEQARIDNDPGKGIGYYYTMRDFMVIVPVGAKFDELLNSGYFVGKPTRKPDLKRPFILRRDPDLYKETRKDLPKGDFVNPFVPTYQGRAVPFAPAPDDSNAYYLVEEPFDWSTNPSESL